MNGSHNYVSVLFTSLLQPIVGLFDLMDHYGPTGPNEVQASSVENGHAASIIVLVVFAVESAVNRTRYVRGDKAREAATDTLRRLGADSLADDAEEVFVLRDVIAHNHLWQATVSWDNGGEMRLHSTQRLPGYGDSKFERVVDPTTRQTRRLRLDVFPTRIHRSTAVVVLKKCAEVLRFLEELDRRYVYLQPVDVRQGTQLVPFYEWVSRLSESA